MELRFVVPNMEKTFGNLEFAGENTTEQRESTGVWLSLPEATTCIPMCREPMMLSLCFLPKLAKNISRRSRK